MAKNNAFQATEKSYNCNSNWRKLTVTETESENFENWQRRYFTRLDHC